MHVNTEKSVIGGRKPVISEHKRLYFEAYSLEEASSDSQGNTFMVSGDKTKKYKRS